MRLYNLSKIQKRIAAASALAGGSPSKNKAGSPGKRVRTSGASPSVHKSSVNGANLFFSKPVLNKQASFDGEGHEGHEEDLNKGQIKTTKDLGFNPPSFFDEDTDKFFLKRKFARKNLF